MSLFFASQLFLLLAVCRGKDLPSLINEPVVSLSVDITMSVTGGKTSVNHDTTFFTDDDLTFLYEVTTISLGDSLPGGLLTTNAVNELIPSQPKCQLVKHTNAQFEAKEWADIVPPVRVFTLNKARPVGVNDVKGLVENPPLITISLEAFEKDKSGDDCTWESGDNPLEKKTSSIRLSQQRGISKDYVMDTITHSLRLSAVWQFKGTRAVCASNAPATCGLEIKSGETLDIDSQTAQLTASNKQFVTNTLSLRTNSAVYWSKMTLDVSKTSFSLQSTFWVATMLQIAKKVGVQSAFFFRLPEDLEGFTASEFTIKGAFFIEADLDLQVGSQSVAEIECFILPPVGNTPVDTHKVEWVKATGLTERFGSPFRQWNLRVSPKDGQTQAPTEPASEPATTAGGGPEPSQDAAGTGSDTTALGGDGTGGPNQTTGDGADSADGSPGANQVAPGPGDGSFLDTAPPWFLPVVAGSVGGTLLLVVCGVFCVFTQRRRRKPARQHRERSHSSTRGRSMSTAGSGGGGGGGGYPSATRRSRRSTSRARPYPSAQGQGMSQGYPASQGGSGLGVPQAHTAPPQGHSAGIPVGHSNGVGLGGETMNSLGSEYGRVTLAPHDINNLDNDPYPDAGMGHPSGQSAAVYPKPMQVYPSQRADGPGPFPAAPGARRLSRQSSSRGVGQPRRGTRTAATLTPNASGVLEPANSVPYKELPKARFNHFV